MKFKKIFPLICLIICLFTVASVCAGEVNDTAITAIDLQDNFEINEDNQVIDKMDNHICAEDSTNNGSANDDRLEIPAPETVGNSYSDKLEITDDNLMGDDLRANIIALNVSALDNTLFVVDCADGFNGNVSIKIGDDALYDGSANVLIEAAKLPAGNYVATALFYGDDNYGNLTLNDISFTVSRVTPTIDIDINDVNYPNSAYAKVHIGNNANGTVNVTIGDITFSKIVSNGDANVELFGLSAGYKDAKIEFFSGDYCNNNVNSSAKFICFPNNSLIEVNYDSIWYVGEDIQVEVNTKNSTGDLTIYINGERYKDPLPYNSERSYDICIDGRGEGNYIVNFHLDGDENYTGYDTGITVFVVKKDLAIDVTDVDAPIFAGTPVTFTARLNESVVGDVIFVINGVNYTAHVSNDDVANYEYTPVNDDMIEVVATFLGNNDYNANSSEVKEFNVNRNPISIVVSVNSTINVGDSAVATINMDPAINATVKLRMGNEIYDVAIVDGVGKYIVSGLAYGHYDVNVTFAGDTKYVAANDNTTLNVNKIENYAIDVTVGNIEFGKDETIVVVLPADVDPSKLTVKVDGEIKTITSMVNGVATIVVPALTIGSHEVDVSYAGDDKYDAKDNNSNNFTVCSSDASLIFLNVDNHTYGENTIFEVILQNDVTKNVTIIVDGNVYSVKPDDNGIANLTLNNLTGGLHEVTATYPGDEKYLKISKSATFIIPRAQSSIDVDFTTPQSVGSKVLFNVRMGQTVNGTVKLSVGDDSYYVAVVDGFGALTVPNLASGTYNVKAIFAGDDKYVGRASNNLTLVVNKIKTKFAAEDITVTYNGNKYLVITLKDSNGKAVGNAKVTVNLNGAKTFTTDSKGQVKVSTNDLTTNVYTAKITFGGNAIYDKSSKDVKVTVKKATPKIDSKAISFKAKVKTKKYTITLKDNAGRTIKNAKLTLKVKGKSYSATTDSKGKATFKIKNLGKKGTYKADIVYGGNNLYNKIAKTVEIKCK